MSNSKGKGKKEDGISPKLATQMVVQERYGRKETKVSSVLIGFGSIGSGLARTALTSAIASGSDIVNQRVGRSIRVKRLCFRGQLLGGQTNSAADDPYNTVRLVVCRGTPGFSISALTVSAAIDSRVAPNAGLLEVLYDKTVVLNVNAKDSTGYIAVAKEWEFVVRCNILIEYGATAAGVPLNNELVIFAASDSVAVVNPGFSSSSTVLVEYVDEA